MYFLSPHIFIFVYYSPSPHFLYIVVLFSFTSRSMFPTNIIIYLLTIVSNIISPLFLYILTHIFLQISFFTCRLCILNPFFLYFPHIISQLFHYISLMYTFYSYSLHFSLIFLYISSSLSLHFFIFTLFTYTSLVYLLRILFTYFRFSLYFFRYIAVNFRSLQFLTILLCFCLLSLYAFLSYFLSTHSFYISLIYSLPSYSIFSLIFSFYCLYLHLSHIFIALLLYSFLSYFLSTAFLYISLI